jgi:hypothetical protein
MPMSPRLLRPRTGGFHPEASDWRSRVIANGGTVSGSTLTAVSNFCRSIGEAGIRDRFYRLNLFCGSNLSACLVPLYRGPSLGGTQYGNTTDTNNNFVSGDYVETGAGGGLTGNGSTKHLRTGVTMTDIGVNDGHVAWYTSRDTFPASNMTVAGQARGNGRAWAYYGTTAINLQYGVNSIAPTVTSAVKGSHILQRVVNAVNGAKAYVNGSLVATSGISSTGSDSGGDIWVFALNQTTATNLYSGDLRCYSLGVSFTDAQALAYHNALQAFQTALGRNL